jgi:hypothetical protein
MRREILYSRLLDVCVFIFADIAGESEITFAGDGPSNRVIGFRGTSPLGPLPRTRIHTFLAPLTS